MKKSALIHILLVSIISLNILINTDLVYSGNCYVQDQGLASSAYAQAYLSSNGRRGFARGAASISPITFGNAMFTFKVDGVIFYYNVVSLYGGESYDTGNIPKPSGTHYIVTAYTVTYVVITDGADASAYVGATTNGYCIT